MTDVGNATRSFQVLYEFQNHLYYTYLLYVLFIIMVVCTLFRYYIRDLTINFTSYSVGLYDLLGVDA